LGGGGEPVNSDLRCLIALQDADLKISSLQKQISEIPIKVQQLQEELQRLKDSHQKKTAQVQELGKQRRAHEGEVDLMRARLAKLRDQLMTVKTNKEYTAMLHEIQGAEHEIRVQEDKVLDVMEAVEELEQGVKSSEKDVAAQALELERCIRELESSMPGLQSEVDRLTGQKTAMEPQIQAELLSRYRQLAGARRGLALAEAKDELCSACHVRIRPQVYANLRRNEQIYACDSCSRILFFRENSSENIPASNG
jgi:predicted  nucleic acid-binding Zn-ribbon protein